MPNVVPKVSIIVPAYNVESYVEECLNSLVRQTLQNIQIICVNDGSTDDTLHIIEDFALRDPRIVVVDKANEGYGKSMNIGFEHATGEYIGIVEPDDYVKLDMFERLYTTASENNLDFIKADFYRFTRDDNGDMFLRYNHISKNGDDYNKVFNPSAEPEALRYVMNTWCGIYKRDFLNAYGIRHHETPGASFQDNGFWFQTFVYGKRAMIIDEPYYLNRRDNPNSSVSDPGKVYAMNREYDYIKDILMRDRNVWELFGGMYWVRRLHNYNATVQRIAPSAHRDYAKRCQQEILQAERRCELDNAPFSEYETRLIKMLKNNPDDYIKEQLRVKLIREANNGDVEQLKAQIDALKKSNSYRIGRKITAVPRVVKRLAKKLK